MFDIEIKIDWKMVMMLGGIAEEYKPIDVYGVKYSKIRLSGRNYYFFFLHSSLFDEFSVTRILSYLSYLHFSLALMTSAALFSNNNTDNSENGTDAPNEKGRCWS